MTHGKLQSQDTRRDVGLAGQAALEVKVLEALALFDTPTVANAVELFQVRDRTAGFTDGTVHCIFPELGVRVGYAVTARITAKAHPEPGEHSLYEAYLEYVCQVPAPRWVVMQDVDSPPGVGSFWGEVNANIHRALDCIGVITNGSVRDLDQMREIGFQAIAGSVGVSHAWVRVIEFGTPVTVAGLTVRSGDLIHADKHGAIVVPRSIAARIPEAAAAVVEHERAIVELAKTAWTSRRPLDLKELQRLRERMRQDLARRFSQPR